jgi:hypothetical protein
MARIHDMGLIMRSQRVLIKPCMVVCQLNSAPSPRSQQAASNGRVKRISCGCRMCILLHTFMQAQQRTTSAIHP